MSIQVSELELSGRIEPICISENYDSLWMLVRYQNRPFGRIIIKGPFQPESLITTQQIEEAIRGQLGWKLLQYITKQNMLRQIKTVPFQVEPISIVVCTRNRTKQLAHCLETLLALEYDSYEIIIVDNAPNNDDTLHLVANMPVRYIREERPGLDWARNRGIAEARNSIIAFTDDDTRVDRYWLQAIAKTFFDKDVMGVSGYVAPFELKTPAQYIFEFGYGGMGHGFQRRIITRKNLTNRQLLWASSFGIGANMAFRRCIFSKIGTFDVALDVGTPSRGAGDVEMFHRLVSQGYKMVYEPSMLVWHAHRAKFSDLRKQIFDNGCSFGCYLITCFKKRSVTKTSILKFFLIDWLLKWNLRNLLKVPRGLSRHLSIIELLGVLKSPFAYRASQLKAKQLTTVVVKSKL